MMIPYRTRCFLKRFGIGIACFLVVFLIVALYVFADLGQYVVYTRSGVRIDLSRSNKVLTGEPVTPKESDPVKIYYHDGSLTKEEQQELSPIIGYYITEQELEEDLEGIRAKIKKLPAGTPVMLDVKSIYGNFFYSSAVSENRNEDIDIAAMDSLIQELCKSECYAIARLPALRDMLYGLHHVSDGLPVAAGYLWMDPEGCYWLNPKSDGTQVYLANIANELKGLGFREIVFADYYFPDTQSIVFKDDKQKALEDTAQILVNACASDTFAVSFTASTYFEAPKGRSRMYLENAVAAEAETLAAQFGFEDPNVRVVFLTTIHDTRFDAYSVLRPISNAE